MVQVFRHMPTKLAYHGFATCAWHMPWLCHRRVVYAKEYTKPCRCVERMLISRCMSDPGGFEHQTDDI